MADRLRTAPMSDDLLLNHEAHGRIPERATRLVNSMYGFGVEQRHLVVNDKPDEDSSAYQVLEVETSEVPFEDADMTNDAMRVFLCHCKHFHHRQWPEEFGFGTSPHAIGKCKHTDKVKRSERRERGDGQASLGEVA